VPHGGIIGVRVEAAVALIDATLRHFVGLISFLWLSHPEVV